MGRVRLALLVVNLLFLFQVIEAIESECSACQAIAEELTTAIKNEKPRNHIDLRHRLDSKGQREGRVIDYRVSELRAFELLEGLCRATKAYRLNETEWRKPTAADSPSDPALKRLAEAQSKEIQVYCDRLLERVEEELATAIREDGIDDIEALLCRKLSRACRPRKKRETARGTPEVQPSDTKSEL
eukprot:TRINITY_DN6709_c0_g1_i2.p2 TRINITY_DN6709_c0_g1~~TRINITY_DN6709_c0_g1_i2.p2  ORF type:complete len:186 (-),score=9.39 TRINITY_DN6709_c0_g1_i2:277-834(-)